MLNQSSLITLQPGNVSYPIQLHNHSSCLGAPHWEWINIVQPVYIMLVCLAGVVGNSFVLCVLCLHKSTCSVAEIYLGNLAAADLLFVSSLPFWAANIASGFNWPFGEFLCRAVSAVISMNLYCSIYLLVMVSMDRYLALVHTMTSRHARSTHCAKVTCLAIWLFGFLMSTHTIIFRSVTPLPEYNITACILVYPTSSWSLYLEILLLVMGFIFPSIIITFCSYHILHVLRNNKMHQFRQVVKETKSSKLVLLVLVMFTICWLPFHLFTFLNILEKLKLISGCLWETVLENGNQITTFLGFTNSCVNPVLYVIVGKHFRKKARELSERSTARKSSELNFTNSVSTHRTSTITLQNRI